MLPDGIHHDTPHIFAAPLSNSVKIVGDSRQKGSGRFVGSRNLLAPDYVVPASAVVLEPEYVRPAVVPQVAVQSSQPAVRIVRHVAKKDFSPVIMSNLEAIQAAFLACDKDGNGKLTWNNGEIREFISTCFRQQGIPPAPEEQIYSVYQAADKDHSYSLDITECIGIMEQLLPPAVSKLGSLESAPLFTTEQLCVLERREEALLENCKSIIAEEAPDLVRDFFLNIDEQLKIVSDQLDFLSKTNEDRFQKSESRADQGFQTSEQRHQESKIYFESRFQEMINNLNLLSNSFEERLQDIETNGAGASGLEARLQALDQRSQDNESAFDVRFQDIINNLSMLDQRCQDNESAFGQRFQDMINNLNILSNSFEDRLQGVEKTMDLLTGSIEERLQGMELREAGTRNDVSAWSANEQEQLRDLSVGLRRERELRESLAIDFTTQIQELLQQLGYLSTTPESDADRRQLQELATNLESEVRERCRNDAHLNARSSTEFTEIRKWIVEELGVVQASLQNSEATQRELLAKLEREMRTELLSRSDYVSNMEKELREELSAKDRPVIPPRRAEPQQGIDLCQVQELMMEIRKEFEQLLAQEQKGLRHILQTEREDGFKALESKIVSVSRDVVSERDQRSRSDLELQASIRKYFTEALDEFKTVETKILSVSKDIASERDQRSQRDSELQASIWHLTETQDEFKAVESKILSVRKDVASEREQRTQKDSELQTSIQKLSETQDAIKALESKIVIVSRDVISERDQRQHSQADLQASVLKYMNETQDGLKNKLTEQLSVERATRERDVQQVHSLQVSCRDDVAGCSNRLDSLQHELRAALQDIMTKLKSLEWHIGHSSASSPRRVRSISPVAESQSVIGSVLFGWK